MEDKYFVLSYAHYVEEYDIYTASVLGCIIGWTNVNKKAGKKQIDGNYWSGYLSVSDISKYTGIIERTVRRKLTFLIDNGIIEKGNFNKKSYDHTGWYRLSDTDRVSTPMDTESIHTDRESEDSDRVSTPTDREDATIPNMHLDSNNITKDATGIEKILFDIENLEPPLLKKLKLNYYKKIAGEDKSKHKDNIEEHNVSIHLLKNYPQLFE